MVFPPSFDDFAAACESTFGRKPIYVSLPESIDETDLPAEAWYLALLADGYEYLGQLGNGNSILELIEGTGFDFERKVCDQCCAGSSFRELRVFHDVSRKRLLDILDKHGLEASHDSSRL